MRKKLIMTAILSVGLLSMASVTSPAGAVNACINLSGSITCLSSPKHNNIDWNANCGTVGISRNVVTGVARCSSTPGLNVGELTDDLTNSKIIEENKFCWCKMVSPAVSKWVLGYDKYESATECAGECSYICAENIQSSGLIGRIFLEGLSSYMTD